MDELLKAAEMAGINETGRVNLNNHVNDDIKKFIQTDSVIISDDTGQERPVLRNEKYKGVLKLEYSLLDDRLVIKDSTTECIGLHISTEQSLELISKIRSIVREGDSISDISISDYSISVVCMGHKRPAEDICISIMQISGEKSKPIFSKEFSGYYGKPYILEGLSFASKKISELCD